VTNYYNKYGGPKLKAKKEKAKQEPIKIDYENKRLSTIYFLPLLLIAGFVPLIVYAKYIDLAGTTQSLYWTGQQQYLDFFSYWKSRWVIALTLIGLVFYIILYKQKKLPFKNLKQYYIPLGIYAVFVVISTIFAKDTQTALWGFVDMYQGMFVLLSYVVITFLTINFVNSERDVNLFVKAFTFLMIVEGLIGITQYFGFDIFQTTIGKSLIVPGNIKVDGLSFSFGPKTIYGTLFNTNFVGSFATLMLPLSVAFLMTSKTKKQRIISAIAVVLMIFTWIGCNSRAGYMGVAISVIFSAYLFRKSIRKFWRIFVGFFAIFAIIFVGLNITSDGLILDKLKSFNIIKEIEELKSNSNPYGYEDIILGDDSFAVKTKRGIVNFEIVENKIYFYDETMKELEIKKSGKTINLLDPRYSAYVIRIPDSYPGLTFETKWGWGTLNFYFSQEGVKIIGSGGRLTAPVVADRLKQLDGLESLMSNRGYIWSRTIPMLDDYFIYGTGADNFPLAFPQDDILAKANLELMGYNTVVDKPHNMYLQSAINTGLLSMISLIVMFTIYFINSFKIYSKIEFDSFDQYLGVSCLLGVLGYLSAGIFNDNVISVAPVFWIVLGLGISINFKLRKNISLN
jgi:hypothetical protein